MTPAIYSGSDVTFTSTGLNGGTLYQYGVTAVSDAGEGPVSTVFGQSTTPSAPENLVAPSSTSDTISLQWQAVAGSAVWLLDMLVEATQHEQANTNTRRDGRTQRDHDRDGALKAGQKVLVRTGDNPVAGEVVNVAGDFM